MFVCVVVRSEKQNNVSFVPQGDDDPNRNAFRACMTTHRIDYVKVLTVSYNKCCYQA